MTIYDLRSVRITIVPRHKSGTGFGWRCHLAKWLLYAAKFVGGIDLVWIGDAQERQ